MSDEQERTEQPTARRLSKAREDGQVARSTELPAAAIVIGTLLILLLLGGWMVSHLSAVFANGFVFDRKTLDRPQLLPTTFGAQLGEAFTLILPILLFTLVGIGWTFQGQLSIVNITSSVESLAGGNDLRFLLTDPMTVILWLAVFVSLLVWGTYLVRTGILRVFGGNLRKILARSIGSRPTAALAGLGVDQTTGNLEGKETRFGVANSALFATVTTDGSATAAELTTLVYEALLGNGLIGAVATITKPTSTTVRLTGSRPGTDYAFTVTACLDAYEATSDLSYYTFARRIADAMRARYLRLPYADAARLSQAVRAAMVTA